MECFKVRLPEDRTLVGKTAQGDSATVYPGEYVVHLLKPKAPGMAPATLRFVGADAGGRDVHIPLSRANEARDIVPLLVGAAAMDA